MTMEELIYSRLMMSTPMLAQYNGTPAVFCQTAPADMSPGWCGMQYPRMDFTIDLQANPERQTSGLLTVNIWCSETGPAPESIEPGVRDTLCGLFLAPEGGPPYSLAWARSDAFEAHNNANPDTLIVGITLLFDLYAFPRQGTIDPDPILAINQFIRSLVPSAVIIGQDTVQDFFIPQEAQPAFYARLVALQAEQETNTVAWMTGTLAGHVFAPTPQGRLYWLRHLTDALAVRGEVTMLDNSPMFIAHLTVDNTQDGLSGGQLRIGVRFGILRRTPYAHPIVEIYKS